MARETKRKQVINIETGESTIREFTEEEYVEEEASAARHKVKTDAQDVRLTTLRGLKSKLLDETITYEELLQLLREGRKV